jgi:hypothetical protein
LDTATKLYVRLDQSIIVHAPTAAGAEKIYIRADRRPIPWVARDPGNLGTHGDAAHE